MTDKSQRGGKRTAPTSAPSDDMSLLDREGGSNRGTKGQTRESQQVARSDEAGARTMSGHDNSNRADRSRK